MLRRIYLEKKVLGKTEEVKKNEAGRSVEIPQKNF